MAGSSFFLLLDDLASLLDDVATLTKVATSKTAGVLGDDLALNAKQVTGVHADRELPVVWAVARGSLINKAILVPSAMLISSVAPPLVGVLLLMGGIYLCFEGFEKLAHSFGTHGEARQSHEALLEALSDPKLDVVLFEAGKIRGAIRTDLILSGEIVVITLGTVANEALWTRFGVLSAVALLMTFGVYGLVAAIVRLDDVGLHLATKASSAPVRRVGLGIVAAAPWLMRGLSVVGTAAMFLVGGGIVAHAIHPIGGAIEHLSSGRGALLQAVLPGVLGGLTGLAVGALALGVVGVVRALIPRLRAR